MFKAAAGLYDHSDKTYWTQRNSEGFKAVLMGAEEINLFLSSVFVIIKFKLEYNVHIYYNVYLIPPQGPWSYAF